jgi:hypothetical protein
MDRIFNLYEINKKYSPHLDEVLKFCFTQVYPNLLSIVVTYEIRVFFEGAQKEVFSSIFKNAQKNV